VQVSPSNGPTEWQLHYQAESEQTQHIAKPLPAAAE
jgi:hypothetical protein